MQVNDHHFIHFTTYNNARDRLFTTSRVQSRHFCRRTVPKKPAKMHLPEVANDLQISAKNLPKAGHPLSRKLLFVIFPEHLHTEPVYGTTNKSKQVGI